MARISAEEQETRRDKLYSIVLELFFEKGWDALTYDLVAEKSGMRKSTLQGYFKTKADFSNALAGRVLPIFLSYLNLTTRSAFVESWTEALKYRKFRYILSMMIRNVTSEQVNELAVSGITRLIKGVTDHLGEDSYQDLELLLGRTVIRLAQQ